MWLMLTLVSPTWAGDCTGEETSPTELGSGTDADPWQLCTPAQLAAMRGPGLTGSELAGSYRLEADLDVADYDWGLGIGPCSLFEALAFTGDFDGAGHTISNLNTHAALWETGLFGCIRGGTVHDLYLDGVFIAAEQQAAGAVSVWAEDAVLSDVHVTNAEIVDSQWATGGLVGVVFESTLERVSYTGTVEGHENVGGLVGLATELVLQDTFAYGTVTGAKSVGGLVGHVHDPGRSVGCGRSVVRDDPGYCSAGSPSNRRHRPTRGRRWPRRGTGPPGRRCTRAGQRAAGARRRAGRRRPAATTRCTAARSLHCSRPYTRTRRRAGGAGPRPRARSASAPGKSCR